MADIQPEAGSSSSDLGALLESADGADLTLVVGGSEFPAHSQILAARSPVFAAMLRKSMEEARSRRIEMKDMREEVLRQVLSFIYTGTAPELGSMAAELLAVADKYDLPLLKERCEQRLAQDLTVENAIDTVGLAVDHHCLGLRDAVVDFLAGHPEVAQSAGYAQNLREDAEVTVEVYRLLALSRPPDKWIVPAEHRQNLAESLVSTAPDGLVEEMWWAFLQQGAPPGVKDADGNSALHKAVRNGWEAAVCCLIDTGVDVNIRGSNGSTPLHVAALASETHHAIWHLLAASAHTDVQDNNGQTPLHLASSNGRVHSTKALLLAGARRDIRDNKGKTPADLATSETRPLFNTY